MGMARATADAGACAVQVRGKVTGRAGAGQVPASWCQVHYQLERSIGHGDAPADLATTNFPYLAAPMTVFNVFFPPLAISKSSQHICAAHFL